jgi:NDP-sugar pyrophosphorylase family protein
MTSLDAFIFAAGLGTRMGPLSSVLPKPAWTLKGKPLLHWAAGYLKTAGCNKIACNAHHHIDVIKSIAEDIEVIEEKELLGTGGPLKRLASRISQNGLLVWNADVIADVPWGHLRAESRAKGVGVGWLLVPHPGGPWTELYLDSSERVLPRGTSGPKGPYLFTGAAWWAAEAANLVPDDCFDVREFLAQYKGHFGIVVDPFYWLEIGTPGQLIHAAMELAPDNEGRVSGCYIHPTASMPHMAEGCILGPGAVIPPTMEDSDALWYLEDGKQVRKALE